MKNTKFSFKCHFVLAASILKRFCIIKVHIDKELHFGSLKAKSGKRFFLPKFFLCIFPHFVELYHFSLSLVINYSSEYIRFRFSGNYQGSQQSGWGQQDNWSSSQSQSSWSQQGWGQQQWGGGGSWKGYSQGAYNQAGGYSQQQGYGNGNWNNWNQQYYNNQYWGQQQQSGQTTAAGSQAVSKK